MGKGLSCASRGQRGSCRRSREGRERVDEWTSRKSQWGRSQQATHGEGPMWRAGNKTVLAIWGKTELEAGKTSRWFGSWHSDEEAGKQESSDHEDRE